MEKHRLDAILITSLENVRWLSGFTGSAGIVFLTGGKKYFLTDGRYTTQASEEARGFTIREYTKRAQGIADLARSLRVKKIGFEGRAMSYQEFREIKGALGRSRLVPLGEEIESIRAIKDRAELSLLSQAIKVASVSFRKIVKKIAPGVRERELAMEMEFSSKKNGSGNLPFEIIVASGPRSALPHAQPIEKKIRAGECVIIDFGASWKGYHSNTTRTFITGRPTQRQVYVYQAVRDAHDKAIEGIRPGMTGREVDGIARGHLKEKGLGRYFRHGLGHGIGLNVHEPPMLSPLSGNVIEEGMVVTIEPGVYIPGWGGVRIEDMVTVTRDGCTVMTGDMEIEKYGRGHLQ